MSITILAMTSIVYLPLPHIRSCVSGLQAEPPQDTGELAACGDLRHPRHVAHLVLRVLVEPPAVQPAHCPLLDRTRVRQAGPHRECGSARLFVVDAGLSEPDVAPALQVLCFGGDEAGVLCAAG